MSTVAMMAPRYSFRKKGEMLCSRCQCDLFKRSSGGIHYQIYHQTELVYEQERLKWLSSSEFPDTKNTLRPICELMVPQEATASSVMAVEYLVAFCQSCHENLENCRKYLLGYILRAPKLYLQSSDVAIVLPGSNKSFTKWHFSYAIKIFAELLYPWVEMVCPVGGCGGYDVTKMLPGRNLFRRLLEDAAARKAEEAAELRKSVNLWHGQFPEASIVLLNETEFMHAPMSFVQKAFFATYMWVHRIKFASKDDDDPDRSVQWSQADLQVRNRILSQLDRYFSDRQDHHVTLKVWVIDSPSHESGWRCLDIVFLQELVNPQHQEEVYRSLFENLAHWDAAFARTILDPKDMFRQREEVRKQVSEIATSVKGVCVLVQQPQLISQCGTVTHYNFPTNHRMERNIQDFRSKPREDCKTLPCLFLNCFEPNTQRAWGLVYRPAILAESKQAINLRPFYVECDIAVANSVAVPKLFIDNGEKNWQEFTKDGAFKVKMCPLVHRSYDTTMASGY